jgi:DNA-binding CsgD family transcriptional regulator
VATQLLRKSRPEARTGVEIQKREITPTESLILAGQSLQDRATRTGTIMLTSSLQLIHLDPRANYLSRRISAEAGHGEQGALPPQVLELCAAVRRYGSFQVQAVTVTGEAAGPQIIVMYGFEIPSAGSEPSRILVLLKETRRYEWPIHHAVERFGLTRREETVVRHLAMGYTNKEIANALCIAEQTVKEHMKHLMLKTGASTRTGLLARVLASSSRTDFAARPSTSSLHRLG